MLWERFVALCEQWGEYPSNVIGAVGINKSAVTNWRKQAENNNGFCDVSSSALHKIASYFHVSIDYLAGYDVEPDESTELREKLHKNPDLRTLMSAADDITPDELRQVVQFVEFIKQQNRRD